MKILVAVVLALVAEAALAAPRLLPRLPTARVHERADAAARAETAVNAPADVQVAEPSRLPLLQDESGAPLVVTAAASEDETLHIITIPEHSIPVKAPLPEPPAAHAQGVGAGAAAVATEETDGDADASPDSAAPEDTALAGQDADPALLEDEPAPAEPAVVVQAAIPHADPVTTVIAVRLDDLGSLVDARTPSGERVQVVHDAAGAFIEIVRDAAGNLLSARGIDRAKGM
jgi:hypothetical protein